MSQIHFVVPGFSFPQPQASPEDPRLKNIIKSGLNFDADLALIGIPFDGGIANGGGRMGAAGGPDAVRQQLTAYGAAHDFDRECDLTKLTIADLGNVRLTTPEIHQVHRLVSEAVAEALGGKCLPFVIGGGHDLTFANVRALSQARQGTIGGINIDAHLDVRATVNNQPSSGTPFRRILEELPSARPDAFVEFGVHGHLAARAHVEYLKAKGASIESLNQARGKGVSASFRDALAAASKADHLFVSFDIDAMAQAFAPGCSAPSPDGFAPAEIEELAFLAGMHEKVRIIDLMEISPRYDVDGRTARVGASILAHVLSGLVKRLGK